MQKVKNNNITHVFKQSFSVVNNKYNTNSANLNFISLYINPKMHNMQSVNEDSPMEYFSSKTTSKHSF